jgi:hypothetical protein
MCILHITCGVALERDHALDVEDVVLDAIAREVGVLDRADADGAGDAVLLVRRQVRILLANDRTGAFLRLVQKPRQADGVAAARLERLIVFAENRSEDDVVQSNVSKCCLCRASVT